MDTGPCSEVKGQGFAGTSCHYPYPAVISCWVHLRLALAVAHDQCFLQPRFSPLLAYRGAMQNSHSQADRIWLPGLVACPCYGCTTETLHPSISRAKPLDTLHLSHDDDVVASSTASCWCRPPTAAPLEPHLLAMQLWYRQLRVAANSRTVPPLSVNQPNS